MKQMIKFQISKEYSVQIEPNILILYIIYNDLFINYYALCKRDSQGLITLNDDANTNSKIPLNLRNKIEKYLKLRVFI